MTQNFRGKIYLLRHGQTDCNKNGLWYCPEKSHINETGKREALNMVETISTINPQKVYCSPFQRCIDTAGIVMKELRGSEFLIKDCLRERNFQGIDGLTEYDVLKKYKVTMEKSPITGEIDSIPNIEGSLSFNRRILKCIDNLISEIEGDKNILLITHGGVIYSVVYQKLNLDPKPDPFFNCALLGLEIENNTYKPILSVNIRENWYPGVDFSSTSLQI